MPMFTWEGKTRTGAVQKGVTDAPDAASVEAQLKKAGCRILWSRNSPKGFRSRCPVLGGGRLIPRIWLSLPASLPP
jgi:type IV pilus assembly protein PilC